MSDIAGRINTKIDEILNAVDRAEVARLVKAAQLTVEIEVDRLEATIADLEDETEKLEEEADGKSGEVADAVNRFLDEVHRPVGSQKFDVPKCGAVDRALLGLHDAIGRRL